MIKTPAHSSAVNNNSNNNNQKNQDNRGQQSWIGGSSASAPSPHWREQCEELAQQMQHKYTPEFIALLWQRGLASVTDINNFLHPRLSNLPSPDRIADFQVAVSILARAITAKNKIGIITDFDVDGASSAALCTDFLHHCKVPVVTAVPDRLQEGYGPNSRCLQEVQTAEAQLLLVLDSGSAALDLLCDASQNRLPTIVVDHHQVQALADKELENNPPNLVAHVNPQRPEDTSNLTDLCAAALVFILIAGTNRKLQQDNFFDNAEITPPQIKQYLDLVALATICDVVPLLGNNRILATSGLKVLNQRATSRPGIAALLQVAQSNRNQRPIDSRTLGFIIGPRINAGSRMADSSIGYRLLASKDPQTAYRLAVQLDQLNQQRRAKEAELIEQICTALTHKIDDGDEPKIIVYAGKFTTGLLGLLASRLVRRYRVPALVIDTGSAPARGSARSIPGIDIAALIRAAQQQGLIISGGGHKMAGGCTLEATKIDALRDWLQQKIAALPAVSTTEQQQITYDLELPITDCSAELAQQINLIAPFGAHNEEPRLLIRNLLLISRRRTERNHLQLVVGTVAKKIKAIAFLNHNDHDSVALHNLLSGSQVDAGMPIDIIANLRLDHRAIRPTVEFNIFAAQLHSSHQQSGSSAVFVKTELAGIK